MENGMTSFQIISIVIAGLGLLFGIVAVFIKSQVDIAKVQTSIIFLQKDLDGKEGSILRLEQENKKDHQRNKANL
jgi:hypothetical protein